MEDKIGLVYFAPEEAADTCMKGLFDGLKEQGIEEGVNLEVRKSHPHGEIANIPLLIQNYDSSDVDVIVTMTTPVLTAAAFVLQAPDLEHRPRLSLLVAAGLFAVAAGLWLWLRRRSPPRGALDHPSPERPLASSR